MNICAEKFHIQRGFVHGILDSHSRPHVDVVQPAAQIEEFFSQAQHIPVVIGKNHRIQFLTFQMDMNTGDFYILAVIILYERNRLVFINTKF